MAGPCSADFTRVAEQLGGIDCATADPVGTLRSPLGLEHWSMPVVEVLMIAGAIATLLHAVRRRRAGDPTPLVLWVAMVVYVSVIEPPLYFPEQFGLDEALGLIFVHNTFTVQFLFDRLPLYIVALYPAVIYLAYVLVERIGVFARRGAVVGAACVAFTYQCFYEVFDHIGPQLRWWAWNDEARTNEPMFGSVPWSSAVVFAGVAPFVVTLLVRLLVARRSPGAAASGWWVAGRCLAVGVLTPLLLPIAALPFSIAGMGDEPNRTVQTLAYAAQVALTAAVAIPALVSAARSGAPAPEGEGDGDGKADGDAGAPPPGRPRYEVVHGVAYLVVFAGLWLAALPDALGAEGGRTADGDPVGNLAYVAACFVACAGIVALAARRGRRGRRAPAPVGNSAHGAAAVG